MSPIMFFIMVTLIMLHSVTQTLATTKPSRTPTQAPGTPTQAPGTPTRAPGAPTRAPGTPTQAPDTPTQAPGTPTQVPGTPTQAPGSPTYAPTSSGYCPAYSASNTYSTTQNYAICSITACAGDTVLMTTLSPGSCNGDSYLRLYDPSTGEELASNDDYSGLCSQITYSFTSSCRTYELREGCFSSYSCSGQVYYSSSLVDAPTSLPSISQAPNAPTQAPGTPTQAPGTPTRAPGSPSFAPTYAPTSTGYCPAYSASYTSSATTNYAICSIEACPGDTVLMTTFSPGSCYGDTYLRLYDPSTGYQLAENDQYGGTDCSQITYTFTASCRTYELREGCWSSYSCGGQVYYTLEPSTSPPTHKPTHKPSHKPSYKPTQKKTTFKPTYRPTQKKTTFKPTYVPTQKKTTFKPTHKPSFKPTPKPSFRPTRKPTL